MRFGVLGPLAVWTSAGSPVTVPEAKVRALLADLLVHEGQVVSADRLVDDLWGDALPANPNGALQAKVSQLRRALGEAEPGGRDLVVRRPPGYHLRLDRDAFDVFRFVDLVERARGAADVRSRADLLEEALGLWRGPALADFADDELARAAVVRWEELRLAALEERADARSALGEHRAVVGELGELVERYPLRERLRSAYMTALYRSGRQSDALDSFEDLRRRLVEERGLDPGPELVALQLAILEQDPALDAPAPAPAPTPTRPPAGSPSAVEGAQRDLPPTNLPASLTELVGRDDVLADLRQTLRRHRLITLTGPGGVGKTRLALETARRAAGDFPDGIWLVELAALAPAIPGVGETSTGEVAEQVAVVLGLRDDVAVRGRREARPPEAARRLADVLGPKRALLVLDNCEHVVDAAAGVAAQLTAAAPDLHILATSQEPLGVAGEVLRAVPPLAPPEAAGSGPGSAAVAEVQRSPAVQLFAARAAAAAPGFEVDADNAAAVAAICRRLDGLPLALELVASRLRVLGPGELADRLDDRFALTAAGRRSGPARQQTLRAMIDWSWELLTAAERTVLRRLAVHVDGCTPAAAEQVSADDHLKAGEVFDLLTRLVDRSLVVAVETPDGTRYRLLESVAAYCGERLREAGEEAVLRRRHLEHYTAWAERTTSLLRGPDQARGLRMLDREGANLRSAIDRAVRGDAAGHALRLVDAMAWYWYLRGRLAEGLRMLDAALSAAGVAAADDRAEAVAWRAGFAMSIGLGSATVEEAAAPSSIEDPGRRARAEWFLGFAEFGYGSLAASRERVGRALAEFRAVDDPWGTAAALATRASQAIFHGDLDAIARDGEASLTLFRSLGDAWGELQATDSLAARAEIVGDYEACARFHRDGLAIAEGLGLWSDVSFRLSGLGRVALLTGDLAVAEDYHERARRTAADRSTPGQEFAEIGLALGARRQGRLDRAESYLRTWLDWNRRLEARYGEALILAELGFVAELRGDADAALDLHREGLAAARSTGDLRAVALALEGMAGAHAAAGRAARAARLLGVAAGARDTVGAPLPQAERADVDRITAALVAALGPDAFARLVDEGRSTPPDRLDPVV